MKDAGKFILNGLMLSAVSLILRTAGVSFNAYVTSEIGAAGTGLFTLVMSVYSPALTLATAGVNLAVSRLTAEELGKGNAVSARSVLKKTILYSLGVSGTVGIILMLLSDNISSSWLGNASASQLLRMLALGLPFSALSSAASGYFTAVRRVSRNAAVQLLEQFFKIAITVFALSRVISRGSIACLAVVVFCSCAADAFSCILLLILCRRDSVKLGEGGKREKGIMKRILNITLPVSVSSFLRSGLVALEHILIPKGLKKSGVSYDAAMSSYGTLSGMAMPIIMFPASFLYSFSGLLIPEFAEANERKNQKEIRSIAVKVIRTVLIFSIGAAGILLGFSYDLGMSIYGSKEAARYIMIMAPLIPVMYLDTAVDSILKGLGEQVWTMKVNIADAFISVLAVWLLVPALGLDGYIIIIFASEIFNFSFSIYRLTVITGLDVKLFRQAALPLLSICGAVSGVKLISHITSEIPQGTALSAAAGISSSTAFYFLLLILLGAVPKNLPYRVVKKICRALPRKDVAESKTKEKKGGRELCR